jgi:hypothetical protein
MLACYLFLSKRSSHTDAQSIHTNVYISLLELSLETHMLSLPVFSLLVLSLSYPSQHLHLARFLDIS